MKYSSLICMMLTATFAQANTFPTNNPDSITLFSHNVYDVSFDTQSNGITVKIPSSESNVTIEVFDGDITGSVIQNIAPGEYITSGTYDKFLNSTSIEASTFSVYLDSNLDGINAGETPIISIPSSLSMDSIWTILYSGSNLVGALTDDGSQYGYYVEYSFTTTQPADNHFKIRSNGGVYQLAYHSMGFASPTVNSIPTFGYDSDGDFILKFSVTEEECYIDIIDGDFDITNDSDDSNTPPNIATLLMNSGFLTLDINTILDEGEASGSPPDDHTYVYQGTIILDGNTVLVSDLASYRRSPNIQYAVLGTEFTAHNVNPSGNQELELFRIKSNSPNCITALPDILQNQPADIEVESIVPGDYFINIFGLDNHNYIYLTTSQDVTSVEPTTCQSGQFVSVVFEYTGDVAANIRIEGKSGIVYFDGFVQPGGLIPISGTSGQVLRGTVDIFINNQLHTKFKTPCSGHFKNEIIGTDFLLRTGITNNGKVIE